MARSAMLNYKDRGISATSFFDLKISELYCIAVFVALFFEAALQAANPLLSFIDEVAVLSLLIAALIKASQPKSLENFQYKGVCYLAIILLAIGLISSFAAQHQSFAAVANDAFTCFKFIITFISTSILFCKSNNIVNYIEKISKLIVIIMLIGWFIGITIETEMMAGVRNGIPSYRFLFPHPTYVVQALVGVIAILSINRKRNTTWIVVSLFLIVLTMRSKAFGFAAAFVVMYIFASSRKLSWYHYVLAICAVILVGWSSLGEYYGDINQARRVMLDTSLLIANTSFPLGSGFASFGTNMSLEHYSPLYYQYGISGVYGLSPETGNYITDSFWPALIGQFGWIGFLLFALIVATLFKSFFRVARNNGIEWLSPVSIMLYLLLSSFGESAFFTPFSAVYLFYLLGLILNFSRQKEQ